MNAVMIKPCSKCGLEKPITEFREDPRYAGGRIRWCKQCMKEYRAAHYIANKERAQKQNAAWHLAHRQERNQAMRLAYRRDPETHIARADAAKKRSPEKYREQNRLNMQRRRAERIDVRLRIRISSQFRYCLSTGKGGRTSEKLLGYTIAELKTHLERQFLRGMSWDNMGEWHIDHIVPLASFTISGPDDPELKRAWALPNLRPLWAKDNISKSDKRMTLL